GYRFVNWTTTGSGSFADSNSASTTFTMPAENTTVTANFELNTYTLTYSAGANGSLTGTTSQTIDYSTDGTAVTAVPDVGYKFLKWSDDVTDNPRTDTNVTQDITVEASFEPDFAGGDGTSGAPFQISTPAHLNNVRYFLTSYFILNNDIDLDVAPYNTGEGW
ncbi:MAG: InlB B-repeat-containing protein, partial [Candidatus Muiribacteriota bacterium]